jgi:hypothetical protein
MVYRVNWWASLLLFLFLFFCLSFFDGSSCYLLLFFFFSSNDVGTTYEVMVALHRMTGRLKRGDTCMHRIAYSVSRLFHYQGILQSTGYGMADSIW